MAEVMNEFSSSNGEVDDENDDITLNGDVCDEASSITANSPTQQRIDDLCGSISSKDKLCSPNSKKLDDNNVSDGVSGSIPSKMHEQNSIKSCAAPTIVSNVANGRLKADALSSAENGDDNDSNQNDTNDGAVHSSSMTKKLISEVTKNVASTDKPETNDCDSSSVPSEGRLVSDDSGFLNCDSNKADSRGQSNAKDNDAGHRNDDRSAVTPNVDAANSKVRRQSNLSADENGARNEDDDEEIVATDLSTRSNDVSSADSIADKKANVNGGDEDDEANEDDEVISISSTPDKSKKSSKKLSSVSIVNITPRRSSRNLNKQQKSYVEKDADFESSGSDLATAVMVGRKRAAGVMGGTDDEIEEITPTDPLADEQTGRSSNKIRNKTIVVSDTKGLVEFASNTKASRSNKKEPTLVIIDTNSILSGRGPIPVSQQTSTSSLLHSSSSSAPIPVSLPIPAGAFANATRNATPASSAFSVIPIGLPAQGMYSQFKNPPPQIKPIVVGPASTSVTPVPIAQSTAATNSLSATTITTVASTQSTVAKQPPVILPSLTDDMFVVEAPSFIVPYVYEKPPMKSLKDHIEKIESDIKQAVEEARREQEERDLKESASTDKTTQSDNDDKIADDVATSNNKSADKEGDADTTKEDATSQHSKQPDQGDSADPATATNQTKEQDKFGEKVDTPKDGAGDSTERMEVDEEPNAAATTKSSTATPPAANSSESEIVSNNIVKKMEIDTSAVNAVKEIEKKITAGPTTGTDDPKKPASYFDNPLGKFFMQIGLNLVQEHVQTDLLRSQKRKRDKEGSKCSQDVHSAIDELTKTLESSKENNDPFKLELKKCELCSFKTESLLVMAHHLETPHMKNFTYRCNFCPLEVRSPHDILFHMEAEHNIRGRLERAPAFHQCPNCPFEDNQKGKLTRHLISCSKKYRPERNQEPPLDWEPPAKIPRVTRNRPPSMSPGNAVYQAAMSGLKQVPQNTLLPKLIPNTTNMKHNMLNAANKRPNLGNTFVNRFPNAANAQPNFQQRPISMQAPNQADIRGMMFRAGAANSQTPVLLPQGYHLSGAQIYQTQNSKSQATQQGLAAAKLLNQPSISITPLPRQTSASNNTSSSNAKSNAGKPMNAVAAANKGGGNFVVCEICDGYIKDLEQLRNHMQWIHKVKIHPKMIYNRPPLNCQKCQERFFTDQGLERHLLGAHGLVTSSMQEAANKGKDGGRCPVCGRVYQWKLLNHVARDHQMALKPAHLSYKCTVCTATFGMYKQFESHVYSAHSVVAKRAMDAPKKPPPAPTSSQNDTLLKPLKINDEITIIPQPVRSSRPINKESNAATITKALVGSKKMDCGGDRDGDDDHDNDNDDTNHDFSRGNDDADQPADDRLCKCVCSTENFANNEEFRKHVVEKHLKGFKILLSRLDLKSFNRIPNKKNAFKLTKFDRNAIPNDVRAKFKLNDFFIEIKRHKLNCDFKYKIVEHRSASHCAANADGNAADIDVVPNVVYSGADDVDSDGCKDAKRKRRTGAAAAQLSKETSNPTLYVKRKTGKDVLVHTVAAAATATAASKPSTSTISSANITAMGGKLKRLLTRGHRNAARQNARKNTTDTNEIDSSSSSDNDGVLSMLEDQRRIAATSARSKTNMAANSSLNPFNDHFMSALSSGYAAQSSARMTMSTVNASRRDHSYNLPALGSCSVVSRRTVLTSRTTANIPTTKNPSAAAVVAVAAAAKYQRKTNTSNPFTVVNHRTVTSLTNSTNFRAIAPRPVGLSKSTTFPGYLAATASNAPGSMQYCRQRSVKVTRSVTTYHTNANAQQKQNRTNVQPTSRKAASNPEAVISLLSDSESDQSIVEIVDDSGPSLATVAVINPPDSDHDNNDEDVYILPT